MAILDKFKTSTLGLKGNTPEPISPAYKQVFKVNDPTPGAQGDEVYNVKSELDLDGKVPTGINRTNGKKQVFKVNDPTPGAQGDEVYNVKSELDLDGKVPSGTYRTEKPLETIVSF